MPRCFINSSPPKRPSVGFGILCLGLACLGLSPAPSQAGVDWELLTASPESGRFEDTSFATPNTGWVVNLAGEIWKTEDMGESWAQQSAPNQPYRAVGAATEDLVWAGTLSGLVPLVETTNGGTTWTDISDRISGPAPAGICGISVVNPMVAYAVGRYDGPAILLKTVDGGASWQSKNLSPQAETLVDVIFFDELHGFVGGGTDSNLGGVAVVLETTDGGVTWTNRHTTSVPGQWCWKFSFPTEQTGYISVENFGFGATVLKTVDGGTTWSEIQISMDPIQGIGFVNEDLGWVSGRGTTAQTTDGGDTWVPVGVLDGRINRIRNMGNGLAYAVGRRVYRYNGSTTDTPPVASLPSPDLFTTQPNPFFGSTVVSWESDQAQPVRVTVYDTVGRQVKTLLRPTGTALRGSLKWDGTWDDGEEARSGVYFIELVTRDQRSVQTVTLLR